MGRHRCRHSYLRRAGAWIGTLVGVVTSLTISIALPLRRYCDMSMLGPLSILISSSRGLEVIEALNYLPLWGRESLSSCLLLLLKLQYVVWSYRLTDTDAPAYAYAPSHSTIFQHKSIVHHFLEVLKISSLQSICQPNIKSFKKHSCFFSSVSTS
jgi:hypothetical protein